MFSLGSIACGATGLLASALLLAATLAPVSATAGAKGQVEYATLCTDVLSGVTSPCRAAIL